MIASYLQNSLLDVPAQLCKHCEHVQLLASYANSALHLLATSS